MILFDFNEHLNVSVGSFSGFVMIVAQIESQVYQYKLVLLLRYIV